MRVGYGHGGVCSHAKLHAKRSAMVVWVTGSCGELRYGVLCCCVLRCGVQYCIAILYFRKVIRYLHVKAA